ncbi:MAG: molybdopterin-binding protein [Thermoanaerobaculia bacterium]|nr:molybdopterin-binding protein [Thermoanaerobaculia bacterium]
MTFGRVEALCVSERKGVQKTPVDSVRFVTNHGIEGDAHAGDWHRQVSLLALEDVESMRQKGLSDLASGDFAENVVVSGVPLGDLGLGTRIRLGDEAILSITQIGKTCHTRCAIFYLAGDCIMPRLGLFARVVRGGKVDVGDPVGIEAAVPRGALQAVVLTISDRCSRKETVDTAGPAVAELLRQELSASVYAVEVLPDEKDQIAKRLKHYSDGHSIDLIVTVGGTGFSPRDVTPEAVASVIERATPGLDEVMRSTSREKNVHAILSRALSGIRQETLILSVPGSKAAAVENLSAVLPALPHGLKKLRGDLSDCVPAGAPSPARAGEGWVGGTLTA